MELKNTKEEALHWHGLINSREPDAVLMRDFESWLDKDSAHRKAYFEMEQLWRDLDYVLAAHDTEISNSAKQSNLEKFPAWMTKFTKYPKAAAIGSAIGAILLAVVLFNLPATVSPINIPAHHETKVAELKKINLKDGSIVTLGAKSHISVSFDKDARIVSLVGGEAFFDVAKDNDRPFLVAVGDTVVRVVGTKFEVKYTDDDIRVAVLEGNVLVIKGAEITDVTRSQDIAILKDRFETETLTENLKFSAASGSGVVQKLDQAVPGTWRSGRLAYEDTSLSEIIADVNRYSRRPIEIDDESLKSLRFTMGFKTSEITQLLAILDSSEVIEVLDDDTNAIIIRAEVKSEK